MSLTPSLQMIEEVLPPGEPGAVTFRTANGTLYFPAEDSVTFVSTDPLSSLHIRLSANNLLPCSSKLHLSNSEAGLAASKLSLQWSTTVPI